MGIFAVAIALLPILAVSEVRGCAPCTEKNRKKEDDKMAQLSHF